MAKSWHFPRWRRLVMQASMWVLLLAAVGAAALVDLHLERSLFLPLGSPIAEGEVTFKLPVGWKLSRTAGPADSTIDTAAENRSDGRTISVQRQRIDHFMSPVQYLLLTGQTSGDEMQVYPEELVVDGWPGQLIESSVSQTTTGSAVSSLTFCVVLPSNQAITIHLQTPGGMEAPDHRLFSQILDSLKIGARRVSSRLDLAGGSRVDLPSDYIAFPAPDNLNQGRIAVARTLNGGWITAEFVPLLAGKMPDVSVQQAIASREELDARLPSLDESWLKATVQADSANVWHIDPQDAPQILLHRRAYVVQNGSGGVCTILTAISPAGEDDLVSAWKRLADRIRVSSGRSLPELLQAGDAALQSIHGSQHASGDDWWLWTHGQTPQGWSHLLFDGSSGATGRETARQNWDGTVTHLVQDWSFPSGQMVARLRRWDADASPASPFAELFEQITTATDQVVATGVREAMPSPRLTLEVPRPAEFVPGSDFPDLLAALPRQPLAVFTERFIGRGDIFLAPVLLAVRPAPANGALRGVEVSVNGTGELSRWYFRSDNSLDHADFTGGLSVRPSSRAEVESTFRDDPRLTLKPQS